MVIVSHNRCDAFRRCLQSLEDSAERDTFQVIAVDNGSRDGSNHLENEFPRVQFIRLPKNFGLTKAMNIGWRAAEAGYILFLHDDTGVEHTAIVELAAVLDRANEATAVCPLLVDEQERPSPQLGDLPPDGEYRPAEISGSEPVPVLYPRGAALMMRVFALKQIRQIDERYGQFGADADLAAQIRRGQRKILLVPTARVRHWPQEHKNSQRHADFLLGRAVFLGKYVGAGAGIKARISSILGPLFGVRWGELRYTIAGQKIDGTHE